MLPTRYLNKINKTSTCWNWSGEIHESGYGLAYANGKRRRAHRIVYELLVGEIPTKLEIDHRCRNRACVNPEHLEPVTHQENMRRGIASLVVSEKWAKPRDCPKGHPLSGDNLRTHYSPRLKRLNRWCHKCKIENQRHRRLKKRK